MKYLISANSSITRGLSNNTLQKHLIKIFEDYPNDILVYVDCSLFCSSDIKHKNYYCYEKWKNKVIFLFQKDSKVIYDIITDDNIYISPNNISHDINIL